MAVTSQQDLLVNVSVDLADSKKSLASLNAQFADLIKTMNKVSETTEKSASSMAVAFGKVQIVLGAVQLAWSKISNGVNYAVKEFAEMEDQNQGLANSLALTGKLTEENYKALQKYADTMELTTRFTAGQVNTLATQAIASGRSIEQTKKLISASANLAALTRTDLQTAFQKLNASLSGSAVGLGKLGLGLENLTEQELKSGKAIDVIQAKIGKLAGSEVNLLSVQMGMLTKAFNVFAEEAGGAIVRAFDFRGAIESLSSLFNMMGEFFRTHADSFTRFGQGFAYVLSNIKSVVSVVVDSLKVAFGALSSELTSVLARILKVGSFLASGVASKETMAGLNAATAYLDSLDAAYNKIFEEGISGATEAVKNYGVNATDAFNKAGKSAQSNVDKAKELVGVYDEATKQVMRFGVEALKILSDIEAQNQQIAVSIVESDLSKKDQLIARLALELNAINLKKQEIKANEKLNELEKERLLTELDRQGALKEEKTKKDISTLDKGFQNTSFMKGVGKITGAVGQFGGWVGAIVQAISSLGSIIQELNKMVINMFNGLSNMGDEMKKLVPELVASVLKFTEEFLPEFIETFADTSLLMTEMLNKMPEATFKALSRLPDVLIKALGETLPKILEEMFQLLIATPVEVVEKVLDALWKSMDSETFGKIVANIVQAIIRGIMKANQSAVNSMKNILGIISGKKIKIDEKSVKDTLDTVSKKLTGATSQVFAVTELTAAAGREKVENVAEEAINKLRSFWEEMLAKLKQAWIDIKSVLWDPFVAAIEGAWLWVKEKVVDPLISGLTTVWLWIKEKTIDPLISGLTTAWLWVEEHIVTPLKEFGSSVWSSVDEKLIQPIKNAFAPMWENFNKYLIEPLKKIFDFKWPKFEWPKFEWPDMNPTIKLDVSKKLRDILGLARGGLVPTMYAANGAFVPQGTDTVPAMLTPGEFVVQRSAVQSLGLSAMNSINQGKMPSGNTSVNIDMKIETTEPIDEAFVRSKLLPRIKEEFRRSSLDGAFVLAGSGIRR